MKPFGVSADAEHPQVVSSDEEALEFVRIARRGLAETLMGQETHEHMLDDCGDDLNHATELWDVCWTAYFDNDGQDLMQALNKGLAEHDKLWAHTETWSEG